MKMMIRKFITWVMRDPLREEKMMYARETAVDEAVYKPQPKIRIGTMDVMNGKLLEVSSYKANPHGPDWKNEYYILEEGVPLHEQIAVVMTMKGMGV